MSYLLTEIALEMLGYKFYDIYGVQDEINNFQNLANGERTPNTHTSNETNLGALLGLYPTSSGEPKEPRRITTQNVPPGDVQVDIPNGLTRLMDVEYNKVRLQVLRNKPTPLATDGQLDAKTVQILANNYVGAEREKLRMEKQNLKSFRRHMEQVLIQMNPSTFEKYCETFKGQRKSLKRTSDGATKT